MHVDRALWNSVLRDSPSHKVVVSLPSLTLSLYAGDTLQEKLGFTEDAQNQGSKIGQQSRPQVFHDEHYDMLPALATFPAHALVAHFPRDISQAPVSLDARSKH